MSEHCVSSKFVERFKQYLSSQEYDTVPDYSKSEYWKYHSKAINIDIFENRIMMQGESGYYVPSKKDITKNIFSAVRSPSLAVSYIKRRLGVPKSRIKLMGYF